PFHYKTITEIIKRAKKKGDLPEKIQPTHGLRKFFENALDKCEPSLDVDKKRQLEGHSLGVRWNYTDQLESLRPLYARAYTHLTLSEDAVADRKVKALLDEVRALRSDNARLHNLEERLRRLENAEGIVSIDGKKLIVGQLGEAPQPIELGGGS